MSKSVGASDLDFRAHFRILVSSRPSLSCLALLTSETPSSFGGVFCVNRQPHNRGVSDD
jgi:hypothetical protein